MIKGLIFDMDGTLVQNMPYHLRAFDVMAERFGFTFIEPMNSRFFGRHNYDIFPYIFDAEGLAKYDMDFLSNEKEAIYRELYAGHVELTAGLDELLAEARALGVKCAIGSAGPIENIEFIVGEGRLADRIDVIVCNRDVVKCKPDPEIFIKSCERLGLDPSECVVFEDAVGGVKASVAAGCHTVALTTTVAAESLSEAGADLVVGDFRGITIERLQDLFSAKK